MLANNNSINFGYRYPKQQTYFYYAKKALFYFSIAIGGFFVTVALLHRRIIEIHKLAEDYQAIKRYTQHEKYHLAIKTKKLTRLYQQEKDKYLKLKLLKQTPLPFLQRIIINLPHNVRLTIFEYRAKQAIKLIGHARKSSALALFLERLQRSIYIPPCSLNTGGYKQATQDYFYHILIRL